MPGLRLLPLLLLAGFANSEECIGTADGYMKKLEELFGGSGEEGTLCPDAALMARIQNMNYVSYDPAAVESLNQYGAYWAFASGTDVVEHYLHLANTLKDKTEWVKQALLFVGFKPDTAANPGKQQLVIFDQKEMDEQWEVGTPNGAHGRKSLRPMWTDDDGESIFQYVRSPFQVCVNPGKGEGHTVTDATMCEERSVPIPEEAEMGILTQNWHTITGCPQGDNGDEYYPEPRPRTLKECIEWCPDKNGDLYCNHADEMDRLNRRSVISCIDYYNDHVNLVSGPEAIVLARVFFEKCMSFNPLFTGLGLGWNHQAQNVTGTEWLVRGDIALGAVGGSAPLPLWQ